MTLGNSKPPKTLVSESVRCYMSLKKAQQVQRELQAVLDAAISTMTNDELFEYSNLVSDL